MNMSRRLAAVALSVAAALVALPATSPATAQTVVQVTQGQTVSLGQRVVAQPTVNPPEAGTLAFVAGSPVPELRFTASVSFTGTATINALNVSFDPIVVAVVNVVGPSGDVAATFTPRPAPGPCITLTGTTIDFGDVEVGMRARAAANTVVVPCTEISQDIAAQVSNATAGGESISWEPTRTEPGPNQFRYSLDPYGVDGDAEVFLGNDLRTVGFTNPSEWYDENDSPLFFNHFLIVGLGSTTGFGEQFSATVTFTATAA
jgi:hypothetical protein